MTPLKLVFTDLPPQGTTTKQISKLLEQKYSLIIDERNPDYVIYSAFGSDYLRYSDAIRIFFTGENVHPDFNLCDYAFGFDWLTFGDRFYRCPNYQLYEQFKDICTRRRSSVQRSDATVRKTKFCNFIYTNHKTHPFRDEFYYLLGKYKKVDSAGAYLNNIGGTIGAAYQGDWPAQKVEFQKSYKFTIAFENSSTVGYTTEKIVHAFAADTIPIYWGNPEVGREFNTKRFVNCHEYKSPDEIIQRIKEIDQNDELFCRILEEPFFPSDQIPVYLRDESVLNQFEHIFSQPKCAAFRRNRYVWGKKYEEQRIEALRALSTLNMVKAPFRYGYNILNTIKRCLASRL